MGLCISDRLMILEWASLGGIISNSYPPIPLFEMLLGYGSLIVRVLSFRKVFDTNKKFILYPPTTLFPKFKKKKKKKKKKRKKERKKESRGNSSLGEIL